MLKQIAYKLLWLFYVVSIVKLNRKKFTILLSFGILSLIFIGNSCSPSYGHHGLGFGPAVPQLYHHDLKVEEVFRGLHFPTRIAFIGPDDILVIEKNNGTVSRILNGTISSQPILDVNVANQDENGMVGIAVSKGTIGSYVFLYFTEADSKDGGKALGNRLYRYELINDKLIRPTLLLDLPVTPGRVHNGGAIVIGPDGNIYLSVGDINGSCETNFNGSCQQTVKTKAQNYPNGDEPDGRAGILRVTPDGGNVGDGILGSTEPLIKYYAYGIRNSFGLDFDPITGYLWDTENGPDYGDEINLVKPGFNSGWDKVSGIWKVNGTFMGDVALKPLNLESFGGKGKYSAPEFMWNHTVGPTAIAFVDTDKLGKRYQNDLLVGDVHNGRLYHFELNEKRTGLSLKGQLADKIANNFHEMANITLGQGFGQITDIKIGPDGYVYVVVYSQQDGEILRIVPADNTTKSLEKR